MCNVQVLFAVNMKVFLILQKDEILVLESTSQFKCYFGLKTWDAFKDG